MYFMDLKVIAPLKRLNLLKLIVQLIISMYQLRNNEALAQMVIK